MPDARITGVGHCVPDNVVTNFDLEKKMNTTDAWIWERTGIRERRYFTPGVDTVGNLGARAARQALERASLAPADVDFIVFASITPDYYFPGAGVMMQRELGLAGVGALDVRNQCAGFIYGLSVAEQYVKSGTYRTVLVVGGEIQSSLLDFSDAGRAVSVIFGDGAGAAVVQAAEAGEAPRGVLSCHLHADGTYAEELYVADPGSSRPARAYDQVADLASTYAYMNGNAVFRHAVVRFTEAVQEALDTHGYTPDDLDLLVPHQANARITAFIQKKLELPDAKVLSNIDRYGNTTAASIPIGLSEAWADGRLPEGALVCLAAFGSGFVWGSALIRW